MFSHIDKFVEISPPSSLQTFGLEHIISQACPHGTAAQSHISFCLDDSQRQPPCEPV